jgi:hypothetical protein
LLFIGWPKASRNLRTQMPPTSQGNFEGYFSMFCVQLQLDIDSCHKNAVYDGKKLLDGDGTGPHGGAKQQVHLVGKVPGED